MNNYSHSTPEYINLAVMSECDESRVILDVSEKKNILYSDSNFNDNIEGNLISQEIITLYKGDTSTENVNVLSRSSDLKPILSSDSDTYMTSNLDGERLDSSELDKVVPVINIPSVVSDFVGETKLKDTSYILNKCEQNSLMKDSQFQEISKCNEINSEKEDNPFSLTSTLLSPSSQLILACNSNRNQNTTGNFDNPMELKVDNYDYDEKLIALDDVCSPFNSNNVDEPEDPQIKIEIDNKFYNDVFESYSSGEIPESFRATSTKNVDNFNNDTKEFLDNENLSECSDVKHNSYLKEISLVQVRDKVDVDSSLNDYDYTAFDEENERNVSVNEESSEFDSLFMIKERELTETNKCDFDWETYLEITHSEAVPSFAFLHVEESLETGIKEGQCLEVLRERENDTENVDVKDLPLWTYWPAVVISSCRNLLRLQYFMDPSVKEINSKSLEFWYDLSTNLLKPIGWSASQNIPPRIPSCFLPYVSDDFPLDSSLLTKYESVRDCILNSSEKALYARFKEGILVEVLNRGMDPYEGIVAKILKNCGGRLLLEEVTESVEKLSDSFWLFCLEYHIKPLGWIATQQAPFKYKSENMRKVAISGRLCNSIPITLPSSSLPKHNILQGMALQFINPNDPKTIYKGTISKVIDDFYFEVNAGNALLITHSNDAKLLPYGFSSDYGVEKAYDSSHSKDAVSVQMETNVTCSSSANLDVYLEGKEDRSASTAKGTLLENCEVKEENVLVDTDEKPNDKNEVRLEKMEEIPVVQMKHSSKEINSSLKEDKGIPLSAFAERANASDLGFEIGQKLEAVDPYDSERVLVVTIKNIYAHLILLTCDTDRNLSFFVPCSSMELFPAGWAQSHSFPIKTSSLECLQTCVSSDITAEQKPSCTLESNSFIGNIGPVEFSSLPLDTPININSSWCPKLFINHFCYGGPLLSKYRIAKINQSVGPGPLRLVLCDIIGLTINSAYIPTRALRELQGLEQSNSSWESVPMKAKFKRYILKINVNIPTAARDIDDFFTKFSKILLCCSNLWSQNFVGENCSLCNKQNLSNTSSGKSSIKRKKGNKKKLFYPLKSSASSSVDDATEGQLDECCDQDDLDENEDCLSDSDGAESIRSGSPSYSESLFLNSSSSKLKRSSSFPFSPSKLDDNSKFNSKGNKRPRKDLDISSSVPSSPSKQSKIECAWEPGTTYAIYGLQPAQVNSDPRDWTISDVEEYVMSYPEIRNCAPKLKENEVDGRAFLLLNLPSLMAHLSLPHSIAVILAQHICKVKLAHFIYYFPKYGKSV